MASLPYEPHSALAIALNAIPECLGMYHVHWHSMAETGCCVGPQDQDTNKTGGTSQGVSRLNNMLMQMRKVRHKASPPTCPLLVMKRSSTQHGCTPTSLQFEHRAFESRSVDVLHPASNRKAGCDAGCLHV